MIQIEESNPSFESCDKCIYSDDSEEMCIFRRCIHAVAQLNECYVPKHSTIEPRCEACEAFNKTRLLIPQPQRKKGKWMHPYKSDIACECSVCHVQMPIFDFHFCPKCGADMREDAEEPKKCDTCQHEKEPWSMQCHRCENYNLWEGKQ